MLIDSLDSYILLFLNNKFYYWSLLNCIENSVGDLFIFTRNDIIFYIEKKIYELFFFQQSSFFVTAFRTLMLQQLHQTAIGPSTFLTRHSFRLRMRRSHVDAQILLPGILFVTKCACEHGLFGIRRFWCLGVGLGVVVGYVAWWEGERADLTADEAGRERSGRGAHLENKQKISC